MVNITDLIHYASRNQRDFLCWGGGKWGLRDQRVQLSMGWGNLGDYGKGGSNNIALIYSSPGCNIHLAYQAPNRPMGGEVVRVLRGITGELSLFRGCANPRR